MVMKTPESQKMKTPQSKKKTPTPKLGGKRPLPDDSEDEEPVVDQSLLKMKKMKRQEESDDSDPAIGSEEESEEDVTNDDDDSEGDEDENDSEGDEDEDDDNEDDEDEDDASDKVDAKASQKQKNKTPAKVEGKQALKQKTLPQTISKSSDAPTTSKVANSHVLLFNFDSLNESLLSGFLKKRGVNAQTIGCIYSPVALLGLPNEEAAKKAVSACSGATYNTRSLTAVMVNCDASKIITNKSKQISNDGPLLTVFVSNLPKSLTTEDIKKIISIEPKSMRLLTSGPKNKLFNGCYIDCSNEADARKAFEALEGRSESGTNIRAFLRSQQQYPAVTETTLIITNAPFAVGVEQMKKEFPTATSVESTRKGVAVISFKSEEAAKKALNETPSKQLQGRQLRAHLDGQEPEAAPTKDTPSKKEAKQSVPKEQKKGKIFRSHSYSSLAPALPAQVGSESEDEDDEKDDDSDDDEEQEDEAGSEDDEEAASEDDDDEEAASDEDDDEGGDEPASEESDEEMAEAPPAKQPKKDGPPQNGPSRPFRGGFGGNRFNGRGRGSPRGQRGGGFRGGNNFRGQRGGRGFGGQSRGGRGGGFKSNWRGGN